MDGAISLCRKAGKLTAGADACEEAARRGKAALVLLTQDLSERSARRMRGVCEECGVPLVRLPKRMDSLALIAGKAYGIFAVCDAGFAKLIEAAVLGAGHSI